LLHCASLVHDDMTCFDDAETRRGKPSVHRAFGVPLAVLAGDALIILAFQTLSRSAPCAPERLGPVLAAIGEAAVAAIPPCPGQAMLRAHMLQEAQRLVPGKLAAAA
jgi:geranylgeranyl diphosphate synthase type II